MCDQRIAGIPLCSCGCRCAYLIWWAIPAILLYTGIFYSAEPDSVGRLEKQFGLGVGPRHVQYDQLETGLLRRKAYEAYFGLRKWSQQLTVREVESYSQLYAENQCLEGCGDSSHSHCVRGLCECLPEHSKHRYGHCWKASHKFSQFEKLRQSPPPTESPVQLPSHCYLAGGDNVLDDLQQHKPECFIPLTTTTQTESPSSPDWSNLECSESNNGSLCQEYDINLVCGASGRCVCRPDLTWSHLSLQCELFLAEDCSEVTRQEVEPSHRDFLLSKTPYHPPSLQQERILAIYCNVLEGIWEDHIENVRGWKHPKHLGYFTTGGMIALAFAIFFFTVDILMLINYLKVYIRSFDPRFQLQSLSRAEKFMLLGGLAASEAVELQEENRDESRAAMMQSNF